MKRLLTLSLLLLSFVSFGQTTFTPVWYKNDSTVVATFTGTSASVTDINTTFGISSLWVLEYISLGKAYNSFFGDTIKTGDKVRRTLEVNQYGYYVEKVAPTSITVNPNVLEDYVYDKTQTNALLSAKANTSALNISAWNTGATLAGTALQPGTSASNITQNVTHRFVTDTEKSTWNAKLSAEVDGSITNEIQTLGISGNTLSISGAGGNSVTLPSASISVSNPSVGNTFTSGTAFQSSTTLNTTYTFTTAVTGAVGLTGTMKVETSTSQFGTYSEYTSDGVGIVVLGTQKSSASVTVGKNTWIKVTLVKDALATIACTYTKVEF